MRGSSGFGQKTGLLGERGSVDESGRLIVDPRCPRDVFQLLRLSEQRPGNQCEGENTDKPNAFEPHKKTLSDVLIDCQQPRNGEVGRYCIVLNWICRLDLLFGVREWVNLQRSVGS